MVVLSAAVITKSGKTLVARQFVEMTRIRIEGLLAAFPKLLGSDTKQHTYVETEAVRYLYQPMDTLYLLLITNRASNIVEDLDTLRLLSKVVPDVVGAANNISEEKITEKCFELIFAFDEVSPSFAALKKSSHTLTGPLPTHEKPLTTIFFCCAFSS